MKKNTIKLKMENKYNHFHKTRVVTRDFIRDMFQNIRSLFGIRMKAYETRVTQNIEEMINEISKDGKIKWHRINIQEVEDGILINIYGELEND